MCRRPRNCSHGWRVPGHAGDERRCRRRRLHQRSGRVVCDAHEAYMPVPHDIRHVARRGAVAPRRRRPSGRMHGACTLLVDRGQGGKAGEAGSAAERGAEELAACRLARGARPRGSTVSECSVYGFRGRATGCSAAAGRARPLENRFRLPCWTKPGDLGQHLSTFSNVYQLSFRKSRPISALSASIFAGNYSVLQHFSFSIDVEEEGRRKHVLSINS